MPQDSEIFQVKLPQFEGPFDLLLFFIRRDELNIYDIPIHKIVKDYLGYMEQLAALNMEQAGEFILFASTLIRIKAKMLLPRKELDEEGNEVDPRSELVDKLLEYKRYKETAQRMAELEAERLLLEKRGNVGDELSRIGRVEAEDSEVESITMFKLMKAFEKVVNRLKERKARPTHVVVKYNYTLDGQREFLINRLREKKKQDFEDLFLSCDDRIHAIFNLLALLELIQEKMLRITIGIGRNNFFVYWVDPTEKSPS